MLHRYIFTLTLILTFGLGQLGLLAHDISHINQHLAVGLKAKVNDLDNPVAALASKDSVSDKASISTRQETKASANIDPKQKPLVADQQTCEKCIGFGGLTFALQQTSLFVSQALTDTPSLNSVKALHDERLSLHQLARAPPHFLA